MNLLAADVGGTKTLFMLATHGPGGFSFGEPLRFDSGTYPDFETMAGAFLDQSGVAAGQLRAACLAVAGPVEQLADGQRRARLTNLPWTLDSERLSRRLGIPAVALINDFEGIAHSLPVLAPAALATLQAGVPDSGAPVLLVGAGTGFGVCTICPRDGAVLPGEGGHAGFAPSDPQQARLWQFVAGETGRCTREHLLSGSGIGRIAAFLQAEGQTPGEALAGAMQREDPAAALTRFALNGEDPFARQTLTLFVRIYGAQTGDLALATLPAGGVYVAGGIAPRILPLMQNGDFLTAFMHKPPMTQLMRRFPVHVITDTHAGLLGAARHAARQAGEAGAP
ncbi:glucokinase [Thioalkalivibrio denitrificans]|uniref:Glucokinase n=1 Tax=Thioalkalivibrio denitrificans TaxID=108003 RepID=A0A1V3NI36_9GAMM|nr:glucokinase [Thioalkalivibrio denitrificans]OOG24769.1 glucokinase [Thioalkalivibrio denitrificans]